MRRGEIWTTAGAGYAGKPRPSVIVQADEYLVGSVAVCGITTDDTVSETMRIPIEPSVANGLRQPSRVMIDKVTTVPKRRVLTRVGTLEPAAMLAVDRALLLFLGLGSHR